MAHDPIDEAYVEIKPDVKDFDRDVDRALGRSFDKIEDQLDDLSQHIEDQFSRLIDTLDKHFDNLQHTANQSLDAIERQAKGAGKAIAEDIEVGTKIAKHEIDDLADNAEHDFKRINRASRGSGFSITSIFTSVGKSISKIFSNVAETVSEVGSKIGSSLGNTVGQIGSSIGTITGGISSAGTFALYAVGIPLVLGLAGAVSQLVGALAALPAAAGVGVTAILPLILAFHGFSDAIGAVLEGDPEKLNEALKKLSPSAAAVVKEFQKLVKPFGEIQKLAQESLFKPLVGTLTELATAVLPALRQGVPLVAAAFGNMFKFISQAFSNGEFQGVLVNTFATTARIIQGATPVLGHFAEIFISLMQIGLPYVEKFTGWLLKGVDAFSSWLEKAIDGGQVTGWLDKAVHVGGQLWEIFKQLGVYVGTLLGSFADEGTDTLDGIIAALAKANEYLTSDDGAETLHNLGVIVHWAGNAFVFLLDNISSAWTGLNKLFDFVRGIGPFFTTLWDNIVSGAKAVGNWFVWLGTTIWGGITSAASAVGGFFVMIWQGLVTAYNAVVNTGGSIINWFVALPGRIGAFLMALPGMFKTFITDSLQSTAYSIGYIIGTLIRFFTTDLPNGVMAGLHWLGDVIMSAIHGIVNFFTETIPALAVSVGGWFADMWNTAYNWVAENGMKIISYVAGLPDKVYDSLKQLQSYVRSTFSDMWHSAVSFFTNLINDVISAARKLPGQVRDAFTSMLSTAYDVGQDIVRGIVNGLRSASGWLWDAAKDLASRAYQGAKDALGIGSPSKEFAKLGKWSAEGFVQGLDNYDMASQLGSSIKTPVTQLGSQVNNMGQNAAPTVNVGGATLVAYLQIGDDQLQPVVVRTMHDNPQDVSLAAQQGDTQLARRR